MKERPEASPTFGGVERPLVPDPADVVPEPRVGGHVVEAARNRHLRAIAGLQNSVTVFDDPYSRPTRGVESAHLREPRAVPFFVKPGQGGVRGGDFELPETVQGPELPALGFLWEERAQDSATAEDGDDRQISFHFVREAGDDYRFHLAALIGR